jgi:hypothetical protein
MWLKTTEQGWATAALKYMQLICRHDFALRKEFCLSRPGQDMTAAQKREAEFVVKATFTVVDVQTGPPDEEREKASMSVSTTSSRWTHGGYGA